MLAVEVEFPDGNIERCILSWELLGELALNFLEEVGESDRLVPRELMFILDFAGVLVDDGVDNPLSYEDDWSFPRVVPEEDAE